MAQDLLAGASDTERLERVGTLLLDWRTALDGSSQVARQILRKLLAGPVVVKADPDGGFEYRAEGTYSRVLHGCFGGDEPGAVTVHHGGVEAGHDLREELRALAQTVETSSKSDGMDGRTS